MPKQVFLERKLNPPGICSGPCCLGKGLRLEKEELQEERKAVSRLVPASTLRLCRDLHRLVSSHPRQLPIHPVFSPYPAGILPPPPPFIFSHLFPHGRRSKFPWSLFLGFLRAATIYSLIFLNWKNRRPRPSSFLGFSKL